jgi:catechol 2,3-dioxygenase-like lactoylglutathione lyase family enzyme
MAVELNHTIVNVRDKAASAAFYTEILGLPPAGSFGPFAVVETSNGVSLDLYDHHGEVRAQHYAFMVSEPEFDEILGRIQARGLTYWADPGENQPGEINHNDGGRGVYWKDLDGHRLEIITKPYGSGG